MFGTVDKMRAAGYTHGVLSADEWRKGKAQAELGDMKSQRSRYWQEFFRTAKKMHEFKPRMDVESHFQHKAYVYDLRRREKSE